MDTTHVRVWAVEGRSLPHAGGPVNGARFVARRRDDSPIAAGVLVPRDSYHARAIARGDLTTTAPAGTPATE
jgi:hypothetical protein